MPKIKEKQSASIAEYKKEVAEHGRLTEVIGEAFDKAEFIRNKFHTVFYLAGGLTGMSEETKERYAHLSDLIAEQEGMFGYAPHLHGTDPVAHSYITPEEVHDIDYLFAAVIPDFQKDGLTKICQLLANELG